MLKCIIVGLAVMVFYVMSTAFAYVFIEDYYIKKNIPVKWGNNNFPPAFIFAIYWPMVLVFVAMYCAATWVFDASYKLMRQVIPRRHK